MNSKNIRKLLIAVGLVLSLFSGPSDSRADLPSSFSPDPSLDSSKVAVPLLNGWEINDSSSDSSVQFTVVQGVTGAVSSVDGTWSHSGIAFSNRDGEGTLSVEGQLLFTARPVLRGKILTLSGAKAVLRGCTGTGTFTDKSENSYEVEVVNMGANRPNTTFTIDGMTINFSDFGNGTDSTVSGNVRRGSYVFRGNATDAEGNSYPNKSITVPYAAERLHTPENPLLYPADKVVGLENLEFTGLSTLRNQIRSGTATLRLGDDLQVTFGVRGSRNARTGVNALSLAGTGTSRGSSMTLHFNDSGALQTGSRFRNSLRIFGYTINF